MSQRLIPTSTVKHLFLDLEDTIIEPVWSGWHCSHLINVEKIKAFIDSWKPDHVHLFSFALWDQHQLALFQNSLKPLIEQHLGIKFTWEWTVDGDIIPLCCKELHLHEEKVSFSDMTEFWSKQEAFRLSVRQKFKQTLEHGVDVEAILIDDMVEDECWGWPRLGIRGQALNIDHLQDLIPDQTLI